MYEQTQNPFPSSPLPPQASEAPPVEPSNSNLKEILSTLGIIIAAPILALFLTTFVFQTYEVDGPSMETTLQDKDRLIVLKLPHTWAKVTGSHYIPKRYDIVVFNHSGVFSGEGTGEKQLIKRVIGLPGERVRVSGGTVTIYNEQSPAGFLVDRDNPVGTTLSPTPGEYNSVVPEGEVFVLGDNRENSLDSVELGTVKSNDLVGKLAIRIYPFSQTHSY